MKNRFKDINKAMDIWNNWFGLVLAVALTIKEIFVWDKDSWWFLAIIWMIEIVAVLQPWNRDKWDKLVEQTRRANDDGSWEQLKNKTFINDPQNPDSYSFSFYEDEKGNKRMRLKL